MTQSEEIGASRISVSSLPVLPFKLIYSDGYFLPIGQHVFPAEKYRRVRRPVDRNFRRRARTISLLLSLHLTRTSCWSTHRGYVEKLKIGTLSASEELELEVPFSPRLVQAFWLAAGGSILAAQHALNDGVAVNIGGGFHHAFADHGEGFCMIHDVAVAIRRMQRDNKIRTAMTVDCDVHHGNGTAAIFAGTRTVSEPLPSSGPSVLGRKPLMRGTHAGDVFTISLHQENNYPPTKPPSSIDVDLARRHHR